MGFQLTNGFSYFINTRELKTDYSRCLGNPWRKLGLCAEDIRISGFLENVPSILIFLQRDALWSANPSSR